MRNSLTVSLGTSSYIQTSSQRWRCSQQVVRDASCTGPRKPPHPQAAQQGRGPSPWLSIPPADVCTLGQSSIWWQHRPAVIAIGHLPSRVPTAHDLWGGSLSQGRHLDLFPGIPTPSPLHCRVSEVPSPRALPLQPHPSLQLHTPFPCSLVFLVCLNPDIRHHLHSLS